MSGPFVADSRSFDSLVIWFLQLFSIYLKCSVIPEGLAGNPGFDFMDPRQNHSGMTGVFIKALIVLNRLPIFKGNPNMTHPIRFIAALMLCLPPAASPALAGSLDNTGAPAAGSAMPTLGGIYNQLDTGTTATASGAFQEPSAGPAATGKSLADILGKLPTPDNTNGAAAGNVLSGKTFWGLRTDGTWGKTSGSVAAGANVSGSNASLTITIPSGLYSGGTMTTASDTNLASGNIIFGTSIFGVVGTRVVKRVNKTGQTGCWDVSGTSVSCAGTGQDGEYQYGITPALAPKMGTTGAYSTPSYSGSAARFVDNGDGTVTDNMTALIWTRNAGCFGTKNWSQALTAANQLASGACGLTDGSIPGQWRLSQHQRIA